MATFLPITSLRSMPFFRGNPPMKQATSTPLQASSRSVVATTPFSSGNAASMSSMRTPSRAPAAGGMSSRCRTTGVSGPSITPRAIIGLSA